MEHELNPFLKVFDVTVPQVPENYVRGKSILQIEDGGGFSRYNKAAKHLNCSPIYSAARPLQSYKYFYQWFPEIRRQLTFKHKIMTKCHHAVEGYAKLYGKRRSQCILIGAHMRRGDYLLLEHIIMPAKSKFMHHAIHYFRQKYSNHTECLIFVVLGSTHEWNLQHAPNSSDVIVPQLQSPGVDLCILAQCDHTILSVGTFGWLAAFLANGDVAYQKEHMVPGHWYYHQFNSADYYPKSWVPL